MCKYQHLEDVLPGFSDARSIIKAANDTIFPLQYKGNKFDFYRFVNRYRMAKQFCGILLNTFKEPTQDGYSALTRVFLVWSVFERYADLADNPPPYSQLLSMVSRLKLNLLADQIERNDSEHKLYEFLHEQSLEHNRSYLERYRDGDRRGVIFYAAALRHIYVHGHLTAHPNGCQADNVQTICNTLSEFLLELISEDFSRRLKVAKAMR
tara:strand:- start:1424 stop:2050 length:627 start_codon:yes stop_codon:yes gene_type:complete